MYFHQIDRDKLYSSLLQGGNHRTPPEMLQRMCNMRNVSWGDEVVRAELEYVIAEYMNEYHNDLSNCPDWETAKKSYVSDRLLERLFTGYQMGHGPGSLPCDEQLSSVERQALYTLSNGYS